MTAKRYYTVIINIVLSILPILEDLWSQVGSDWVSSWMEGQMEILGQLIRSSHQESCLTWKHLYYCTSLALLRCSNCFHSMSKGFEDKNEFLISTLMSITSHKFGSQCFLSASIFCMIQDLWVFRVPQPTCERRTAPNFKK